MIEYAGLSILREFITNIRDTTPSVAPIMSILLIIDWSYGTKELNRQKMDLPYRSYIPLAFEYVKTGRSSVSQNANRMNRKANNQLLTGYRIYQNDMSLYEFDISDYRSERLDDIRESVL